MQIENFKIFADLVETKSFSKAAKLNGITQSAVSQQTRAMEKLFKALLIDRSQKQFQLTREGQRVYEGAKDILNHIEGIKSELLEMKRIISGTIRISTIYSIGLHELPPYIKAFLQTYPEGAYAPNARYWLGESYYVTQNYALAREQFQALIDRYPTHDKTPGALLKVGLSQYGLRDLDGAETTLAKVASQYPGTDAARTAEDRLHAIQIARVSR